MARHPLRRGVFVLLTPDAPIIGNWLRTRYPFQARLWEVVLGGDDDRHIDG